MGTSALIRARRPTRHRRAVLLRQQDVFPKGRYARCRLSMLRSCSCGLLSTSATHMAESRCHCLYILSLATHKRDKRKHVVGYILSTLCALMLHNHALYLLPVHGICALYALWTDPRNWRCLAAYVVTCLVYAPWLQHLMTQVDRMGYLSWLQRLWAELGGWGYSSHRNGLHSGPTMDAICLYRNLLRLASRMVRTAVHMPVLR